MYRLWDCSASAYRNTSSRLGRTAGFYGKTRSETYRWDALFRNWNGCGLWLVEVFHADFQRAKEFEVLRGHFKFHFAALQPARGHLLAAVTLGTALETDRRFEDEENVIAGIANVLN